MSRPGPFERRNTQRSDGNGNGAALPRGRHRLPREVVLAYQRERLLRAAAVTVAEHGYSSLTVQHIIAEAGTSRSTFYEHFENKQDCLRAAFEDAFNRLLSVISAACASRRDWPDGVAAAVSAAIDWTIESPAQAGLLASNALAADPEFARPATVAQEHLASLLRAGREHRPGVPAALDLTEQALVGATMAIVAGRLTNDEVERLPQLRHELVQLVLTPYLGGSEAKRLALAA